MSIEQFSNISLRGRVAYAISCLENMISALEYDINDWEIVLNYLWTFTDIRYLDDWNEIIVEVIPENLLEFETYEEQKFAHLSKEEYLYLRKLYKSCDLSIHILIREIFELGISHAYSVIEGHGKNSLKCMEQIILFMEKNQFPLPDVRLFLMYSFEENRGWGNRFNGKRISKLLRVRRVDKHLYDLITKVKVTLEAEPDSIIYGELGAGRSDLEMKDTALQSYLEFLKQFNGARCGAIDLWSFETLSSHQYRIADIRGGPDQWLEIGQILYEPLVINKYSGHIYYCKQDHQEVWTKKDLGDFNHFLCHYVFGLKYEEIVPDVHQDEWYSLLDKINRIS